jgi:DNA polymerase
MDAEQSPREELLGLVRSLAERIRLDGELGKPRSYLRKAGTAAAVPGGVTAKPAAPAHPTASAAPPPAAGEAGGLSALRLEMGDCRRCSLADLRHNLVFGEGNPRANLVFVGEAPGADEDAQGRPFVGRAGQLLTKIIAAMGLSRDDVYICNILKCRPPENRNPLPAEIAACEPFLIRQLAAIRPKVICALGTFAAHALLKSEAPITVLRGRFHQYQGIPLMPTFHPAYLLRNEGAKRQVWDDVRKIMKLLEEGDLKAC